ncbi:MAG TPA: hypothetical protein VKB68_19055 [Stellaceae bacterium]|nr:hypothetical protein [Stellaceae bacterium]
MDRRRPLDITIIASLMIAFGLAEIITGFTHSFLGLHTAQGAASAYIVTIIGALYAAAGFLILTMTRHRAILAIALLVVVVAGRIAMVMSGLYPVGTFKQTAAIVLGTSIAAGFAIYIGIRRSAFR